MSEKRITLEMIDALIAKSLAKVNGEPPVTRAKDSIDYACDAMEGKPTPIIAKGPASKPQPLHITMWRRALALKRMDPAIQMRKEMRKEMNRLGIKSDDKRQFTVDLAGRLMYYGDDHIPRYVETGTRTPPDSPHSMPSIEPPPVSYPSGVVPPERAMEAALRDGGCIVKLDTAEVASAAQEARWKAARSARDEARIKAKRWKRGDKVQMGEGDEHDTGEVMSALEHMVRVKWNKANAIYNEDPQDLEWWDGTVPPRSQPNVHMGGEPCPETAAHGVHACVLKAKHDGECVWDFEVCVKCHHLKTDHDATLGCQVVLASTTGNAQAIKACECKGEEPPKVITTPQGLKARVVTPRSTEDKLHEWHREHGGEMSLPNRDK